LWIQLERRIRWQFQSPYDFFGLPPEYKPEIHEQIFQLILHSKGGITFSDAYNLPIYLRHFYLRRLQTFYKKEAEELRKELDKHKTSFRK
jgi:hypothetical protein